MQDFISSTKLKLDFVKNLSKHFGTQYYIELCKIVAIQT